MLSDVHAAVQVEFARTKEVRVHESQAAFNVCLVKRGENSCPVTALVATCSGLSGLPAATGEGEGGDVSVWETMCLREWRGDRMCVSEQRECIYEPQMTLLTLHVPATHTTLPHLPPLKLQARLTTGH